MPRIERRVKKGRTQQTNQLKLSVQLRYWWVIRSIVMREEKKIEYANLKENERKKKEISSKGNGQGLWKWYLIHSKFSSQYKVSVQQFSFFIFFFFYSNRFGDSFLLFSLSLSLRFSPFRGQIYFHNYVRSFSSASNLEHFGEILNMLK